MNEGATALGKLRGYTYIIFFMLIAMLFHERIAEAFGTSDRKIHYGFIMLIVFQILFCILYIVKYASTVGQNDRKRKLIMGYAASIRLILICQAGLMVILVLNSAFEGSPYIDKGATVFCILLQYYILKYLTILQRKRY